MKVVSIFKIPNNSSFPKTTKFPQNQRGKTGWFVPAPRKTPESFQKNGRLESFSWTPKKGESDLGVRTRKELPEIEGFGGPEIEKSFGVYSFCIQAKERKHGSQKAKVDEVWPMVCGFFDWWILTWLRKNCLSPLRWYPKTGVILWRSGT